MKTTNRYYLGMHTIVSDNKSVVDGYKTNIKNMVNYYYLRLLD